MTVKKAHLYFEWRQCFRAQKADNDFCMCIYGKSLHHQKTTRKTRIEQYLGSLEAEAKEFGFTLSQIFRKRLMKIATTKNPKG